MNAHTPGPWHVRGCDGNPGYAPGRHIYAPTEGNTGCVAVVTGSLANAHLIAAAPDLLAALEALLSERYACESIILDAEGKPEEFDANGNWTCNSPASVAARAAIAKARGEA